MTSHRYYIIYKPYNMLSQFSEEPLTKKPTLTALNFPFPKDAYPVGRLDSDSEGLLIITDDKSLTTRLLHPTYKHERTYWVQVERQLTTEACKRLENGVIIQIDSLPYRTLPAKASMIYEPENLPDRYPPVRYRAAIPTSWLELTLHEGKNRQVRRMTATIGFPTLRLIRKSIELLTINGLKPGDVKELSKEEIMQQLKLKAI